MVIIPSLLNLETDLRPGLSTGGILLPECMKLKGIHHRLSLVWLCILGIVEFWVGGFGLGFLLVFVCRMCQANTLGTKLHSPAHHCSSVGFPVEVGLFLPGAVPAERFLHRSLCGLWELSSFVSESRSSHTRLL